MLPTLNLGFKIDLCNFPSNSLFEIFPFLIPLQEIFHQKMCRHYNNTPLIFIIQNCSNTILSEAALQVKSLKS